MLLEMLSATSRVRPMRSDSGAVLTSGSLSTLPTPVPPPPPMEDESRLPPVPKLVPPRVLVCWVRLLEREVREEPPEERPPLTAPPPAPPVVDEAPWVRSSASLAIGRKSDTARNLSLRRR